MDEVLYEKQMTGFMNQSKGGIKPNELSMYLSVFHAWVGAGQVEWFEMSYSECGCVGMYGRKTFRKARIGLEEKGFVETRLNGIGKPLLWHLVDMTPYA